MSSIKTVSSIAAATLLLAAAQASAGEIDPVKWLKDQFSGPTVDVPVQHPPESQIRIEGVAIAPAEGRRCAQALTTRLEQAFLQAGVTVVDRQQLDKVLAEHKLKASDIIEEKTAAKIGHMIGAQALLFTQVARCDTARRRQESFRDEKTGKVYYDYITQANLGGTMRVIALTTGRVVVAKPFEAQIALARSDTYPDAYVALSEAEKSASESVKKTLLPWTEIVSMPFHNDKQCELSTAHGAIKAGDFSKALEQSRTNAASCAATGAKPAIVAKAHHNVGVLQMYFGDYDAALQSFTEAGRIYSSKTASKALADCRRAQQHSQALAVFNSTAPGSVAAGPASPGTTFPAANPDRKRAEGPSVKERLVELNDLCNSQLLTPEECTQRRAEILKQLDAR